MLEEPTEKTSLSKPFCFYYRMLSEDEATSNSLNSQQYQTHVKKIASFSTVEDFWGIFQHLKKPDSCPPGVGFYLFKDDIKPLWEEESHRQGGRISFKLKKNFTSVLWEEIVRRNFNLKVMAFIGDVLPQDLAEEITGIIVSVKGEFNVIQFWVKDFNNKDHINSLK